MEKDKMEESIVAKSEVVVDGDMSVERITDLIELGHEEECLDYKEKFDFTSKPAAKRSKIDLVCDIVSMTNTDGGYIIVGVKDNKNGTFSPEGVDESCLQRLTQEDIQNLVSSYVDATLRILCKPVKYNNINILAICVFPGRLPVPFRKNGQYQSPKGNPVTKFCEGEIFVRHGAKSERASYEDWIRITEKIRGDERRKVLSTTGGQKGIIDRLDIIIQLLGGAAPPMKALDLAQSSEEDVEDRVAQLLTLQNSAPLRRTLQKEFNSISKFLESQKQTKTFEELVENLDRTFVGFLMQLFAVWVTAIEYDNLDLAQQIVEGLHKLYVRTKSIDYTFETKQIDSLWLQSRCVFLAYCLGAFAVVKETWFRYILVMLSRANRLEKKSLCISVFDFLKDNPYIIGLFGGEDELKSALCQFDFLQCADTSARNKDCYPSFAVFYKSRIEPIVEEIIETCETGQWISKIEKSICAEIIDYLDKYAAKEFGFYFRWDYGKWRSIQITEFLKKYKSTSDI